MNKNFISLCVCALFLLAASPALCLIDINSASQSELESLPSIGKVKAERIIKGRPYRSVNDLVRVKGIGYKTLAKFKNLVTVGKQGKKKKEAAPAVEKEKPAQVPIFSVERYRTLKCHKCGNRFRVSSKLMRGWCPYCVAKWALKGAPPPKSSEAAAGGGTSGAISWKDAAQHIGKTITVKGGIVGTYLSTRGSGNLYLNFHQDFRNNLSVKIPKADLGKFRSDAADYYKGKTVLARGRIEKDKRGYLRIVVTGPKDLKVLK